MPDMATKKGKESMPEENVRRVRQLMGRLLKERFDDNYSEFGRRIGTSGQSISQILAGENKPGWGTVAALRTYLGSTWDQVLAGEADTALEGSLRGPVSADVAMRAPSEGAIEHMGQMLQLRDLPRARYPQLEYAIAYHAHDKGRWSPISIMSARQGQFETAGCETWTPPQWTDALDRLESVVRQATSPQPPQPTSPRSKKS